VAAGAVLVPCTARAHLLNTGLGPFYDGVTHFALSPEDLLPALALAILAGQRGAHVGRLALRVLPLAWLLGGVAGLTHPTVTTAGVVTAVSFLVLGGLVAAEARLGPAGVGALAALLGLVHGYLNGCAMAQGKLGTLSLTAIVGTLFVAVALMAAFTVTLRRPWARVALRVAGSWIAAVGLLLLGWSLRPAA
jgi:hydrogenase/urease accessory protein HupE